MLLDVNSPFGGESLDRSDPAGSYHVGYLSRIFAIVEAFKNYPNTLGFFGANEVINDGGSSVETPPYIRVRFECFLSFFLFVFLFLSLLLLPFLFFFYYIQLARD